MNAMTSVRQRCKLADTFLASTETPAQFTTRQPTLGGQFDLAEDAEVDASVNRRKVTQDRAREEPPPRPLDFGLRGQVPALALAKRNLSRP